MGFGYCELGCGCVGVALRHDTVADTLVIGTSHIVGGGHLLAAELT